MTARALIALAVLGAIVAATVLLPLRAVDVELADGTVARVYDPARVGETSDGWDYLQQARQLYRGEGFTSLFTYPPYLPESRVRYDSDGVFPQVWRAPAYPLLLAASFRAARSPEPNAVLAVHASAIILLPVATFAFARAYLGVAHAAAAAAFTLLTPYAVGVGDPLAPTVVFLTLLTATLALAARTPLRRTWPFLGAAFGVLSLLRLETWLILPGVFVAFRWWRPERRVFGALVVMFALAIPLPWHAHVASITDAPHNHRALFLHDTAGWDRWEPHRSVSMRDVSLSRYAADAWPSIAAKTSRNAARFGRDLASTPAPGLGLVGLAAIAVGLWRRRTEAWGVAAAAVLLIGAISPLEYGARFVAPLVPALVVAGVVGARRRIREARWGRAAVAAAIAVAVLHLARSENRVGVPRVPSTDAVAALIGEPDPSPSIVVSDTPTLVSWLWDRPSVWAPLPRESEAVSEYLSR